MENIHSNIYSGEENIVSLNHYKEQHICEQSVFKEYNYTSIGNNSNMEKHNNKPKSYSQEGDNAMDDDKILEKFLEKVDQDKRDMENRLTEDRKESEKRIEEQRRLSEERMEKRFDEAMTAVKDIKADFNSHNQKIDTKIDTINDKIDTKIDSVNQKIDSTNKWIIGLCLSTIIGIAAIAITVIVK